MTVVEEAIYAAFNSTFIRCRDSCSKGKPFQGKAKEHNGPLLSPAEGPDPVLVGGARARSYHLITPLQHI